MASVADTSDRYEVIAFQCGVTVDYVHHITQWLRELGVDIPSRVQPREVSPKRQAIEKDIVETSVTFTEIGVKYGLTDGRISQIATALRERGIAFPERPRYGRPGGIHRLGTKGLRRQAIEKDIVETSMTFVEIAAKHGVNDKRVSYIAKLLREEGVVFVKRPSCIRSTPQPCDPTSYPRVQMFNWMREVS